MKTHSWADAVEEDGSEDIQVIYSEPDKDGNVTKTTIELSLNEAGERVKKTTIYKVSKKKERVPKSVLARRKWEKFGDCIGLAPGPEKGMTILGEEVMIELTKMTKKQKEDREVEKYIKGMKGGEATKAWTMSTPGMSPWGQPNAADADADAENSRKKGVYVPPRLRGEKSESEETTTTVRISNICEDATESDLRELLRPFGHVHRLHLVKDRHTGESRGFAFVEFVYREDAERCIKTLNGYGYANLILHLEWARPSVH